MSEGKRLIMCNALESGGIVAEESQTARTPDMLDQRILFVDAEAIVIASEGGELRVPYGGIASARTVFEWKKAGSKT